MEIIFALIASIAFGFDVYLIRRGLIEAPYPIVAAFISLTINITFFVTLSLFFVPVNLLKLDLIYLFIIAGLLAPGCARWLSYKGLETLGASISAPIVNSDSLFSVLMALIFLKEPINGTMGIGIMGVIIGIVLLSYETGRKRNKSIAERLRYRYLFFPIVASLFYGISVLFRKLGLNLMNSPILGATFTSGTSWLVISILLITSRNHKRLFQGGIKRFAYFFMAGGATCIAWLSVFYALRIGRIAIVAPISSSSSLFTLFLSYVFLRRIEHISLKIVVATILIVGGIILLSIAK